MRKLTAKEESFAQTVTLNSGDKVQALKDAGYAWKNYSKNALGVQADKIYNRPNVNLRIEELQKIKTEVANDEFKIDAAWVLKQAKKVHERCMQSEQVLDRKGEPVLTKNDSGDLVPAYTFEAAGANKSLEIIGKHIDVQAFNENLSIIDRNMTPWGSVKASVDKLDK